MPREVRAGTRGGTPALLREMDAVIVHSLAGKRRLVDELRVPPERVHLIPHGAFDYLTHVEAGPPPAALDGLDGRRWSCSSGSCGPTRESICSSRRLRMHPATRCC